MFFGKYSYFASWTLFFFILPSFSPLFMQVSQAMKASSTASWTLLSGAADHQPQLVIVTGYRQHIETPAIRQEIRDKYPTARVIFCSTSGEIADVTVYDQTLIATAISFDKTTLSFGLVNTADSATSAQAGKALVSQLPQEDLRHVLIFSDGLTVNGTDLISGMNEVLKNVSITGGLAGDGPDFKMTLTGLDDQVASGNIVAVGLHGQDLRVGYGSYGGWDPFGPERIVTKSVGNVLYELDNKPALELYKTYLGEKAKELPASGLLFPLGIYDEVEPEKSLVRTLLAVDENTQSLTFAGDIPAFSKVRLMKANFDRLVDGAENAAKNSTDILEGPAQLALLVSCVGRKLVMNQLIEDEVETVRDIVGDQAVIAGFYSYGELAPSEKGGCSYLHNQTMTITLLAEA